MAAWANNAKPLTSYQSTYIKSIKWIWNGVAAGGAKLLTIGQASASFFWK